MKYRKLYLISLISIMITAFPQKSTAVTSFDIHVIYTNYGLSDRVTSMKPEWVITNTSSQTLVIGDNGLTPFATMDFGSLPIQSPTFVFHPELISGYTLNPGESVGWNHIIGYVVDPCSFWPRRIYIYSNPTYDLSHSTLFEINGDSVVGAGTGNLELVMLM